MYSVSVSRGCWILNSFSLLCAQYILYNFPSLKCIKTSIDIIDKNRASNWGTDLKSNQLQNYPQTYIIKIMDIMAYFLSLLLDWLNQRFSLDHFLCLNVIGQSELALRYWVQHTGVIYKETLNLGFVSIQISDFNSGRIFHGFLIGLIRRLIRFLMLEFQRDKTR